MRTQSTQKSLCLFMKTGVINPSQTVQDREGSQDRVIWSLQWESTNWGGYWGIDKTQESESTQKRLLGQHTRLEVHPWLTLPGDLAMTGGRRGKDRAQMCTHTRRPTPIPQATGGPCAWYGRTLSKTLLRWKPHTGVFPLLGILKYLNRKVQQQQKLSKPHKNKAKPNVC